MSESSSLTNSSTVHFTSHAILSDSSQGLSGVQTLDQRLDDLFVLHESDYENNKFRQISGTQF